jgi:hypothetical protein
MLCSQIATENLKKKLVFVRKTLLGKQRKKKLVKHVQRLGASEFTYKKQALELAYQFTQKLNISHKFRHQQEMAG